ncbi:MAG: hypothetical protein R3A80_03715 [Bdellovibrionota bacterium]
MGSCKNYLKQTLPLLTLTFLNLAYTAENKFTLTDVVTLQSEAKTITTLFEDKFKVIGIGLKTHQKLEKHQTNTKAFLLVQSGRVQFDMNKNRQIISSGEYIEIPIKKEHEVKALEDSILLLIK